MHPKVATGEPDPRLEGNPHVMPARQITTSLPPFHVDGGPARSGRILLLGRRSAPNGRGTWASIDAAKQLVVIALCLCSSLGCGAWDEEAPVDWTPPACERFGDRLAGFQAHIDAGGLTHLRDVLDTPEAATDLRTMLRLAQDLAPSGPAPTTIETTQPSTLSSSDVGATLAFVDAAIGEMLTPPPEQDDAVGTLAALRSASTCSDKDAWLLIATVLRDPRAAITFQGLVKAALRPTNAKISELTPVGLNDDANFLQLANTLLRSLADPAFDPTTLLDLLSNLATTPDGILSSLGAGVRLLVTSPSGDVDPTRRAQAATLLTCARAGDTVGALPWLLHGLLIRQPGLSTKLPDTQFIGATLEAAGQVADAFVATQAARPALRRLLQRALTVPVLTEVHALTRPPLAKDLEQLAVGLAESATCTAP